MAVRSAEFAIPVADGLQPRAFVPLRHPARAPFRLQPLKAMKVWAEFKRDKEQIHLAFSIFNALPWTTLDQAAARFLATDEGRRIYASEPSLPEILDDHAALRRMGGDLAGDVGRHVGHTCHALGRSNQGLANPGNLALGRVAQFHVERDIAAFDLQVFQGFGGNEIFARVRVNDG